MEETSYAITSIHQFARLTLSVPIREDATLMMCARAPSTKPNTRFSNGVMMKP